MAEKKKSKKQKMTVREWFADRRDAILDWWDDVLDWWDDLGDSKRNLIRMTAIAVVVLTAILVTYGVTTGFSIFAPSNTEAEQTEEEAYVPAGADDPIEQTQELSSVDAEQLGYDPERARKDEIAIKEFCKLAFNFSNQDDYLSNRGLLVEAYKGFDDWQIGTEFMPLQFVGNDYSLSFMQVEAYVSEVKGDAYLYTCDVVVRSKSPNGGEATSDVLLLVTTNGDGSFRDVKAYATTVMS